MGGTINFKPYPGYTGGGQRGGGTTLEVPDWKPRGRSVPDTRGRLTMGVKYKTYRYLRDVYNAKQTTGQRGASWRKYGVRGMRMYFRFPSWIGPALDLKSEQDKWVRGKIDEFRQDGNQDLQDILVAWWTGASLPGSNPSMPLVNNGWTQTQTCTTPGYRLFAQSVGACPPLCNATTPALEAEKTRFNAGLGVWQSWCSAEKDPCSPPIYTFHKAYTLSKAGTAGVRPAILPSSPATPVPVVPLPKPATGVMVRPASMARGRIDLDLDGRFLARPSVRPSLDYQFPPGGPPVVGRHADRPDDASKVRRVPKALMAALALFHTLTEIKDFIDAVHDALGIFKDPNAKTWWQKLADIAANWWRYKDDPSVFASAIVNLVYNEIEDRVVGRLLGMKAARAARWLTNNTLSLDRESPYGSPLNPYEADWKASASNKLSDYLSGAYYKGG